MSHFHKFEGGEWNLPNFILKEISFGKVAKLWLQFVTKIIERYYIFMKKS